MAAVYSSRLYRVSGLNGGSGTITVPAGEVWIVRDVDAYSGAVVGTVTVRFLDIDTGGTIWENTGGINTATYASWRGRQVFEAGDSFAFSASDLSDIRASGYKLLA